MRIPDGRPNPWITGTLAAALLTGYVGLDIYASQRGTDSATASLSDAAGSETRGSSSTEVEDALHKQRDSMAHCDQAVKVTPETIQLRQAMASLGERVLFMAKNPRAIQNKNIIKGPVPGCGTISFSLRRTGAVTLVTSISKSNKLEGDKASGVGIVVPHSAIGELVAYKLKESDNPDVESGLWLIASDSKIPIPGGPVCALESAAGSLFADFNTELPAPDWVSTKPLTPYTKAHCKVG